MTATVRWWDCARNLDGCDACPRCGGLERHTKGIDRHRVVCPGCKFEEAGLTEAPPREES